MAKVLKNFRERFHGMKRYNVGDDYPEDNAERVQYLVRLGYLQEPEQALMSPDAPEDPEIPEEPDATDQQPKEPVHADEQKLAADSVTKPKRKKGADANGDPDA